MRWIVPLLLGLSALFLAAFAALGIPATGAGLAAKQMCSGVFVAARAPADVLAADILPANPLLRLVHVEVDAGQRQVRGRMLWSRERTAALLPGLGCVLDPTPGLRLAVGTGVTGDAGVAAQAGRIDRTDPTDQAGRAERAEWAKDGFASTDTSGAEPDAIRVVVDEAFDDRGAAAGRSTRAIVILHRGQRVAERYGPGFDAATPQLGWSMSKTVLGLLVYMKLKEQQQDAGMRAIDWVVPDRRPPWLQAWQGDARGKLTLSDLIFMRDGLDSRESYAPWSAVPRMLWGTDDAAAHAGSASSEAPPGQRFRYLSATANILSRLLRAQFDSDLDYWRYPRTAFFDPIGARSAVIEADPSGTFIASSYLWATPLDWARIGEVLRRDGLAGDKRVFPAGWQHFAGTPPPSDDPAARGYGAHVWLAGVPNSIACGPDHGLPADTFLLSGHWSQLMAVVPSREAVVLRLGMTLDRSRFDGCGFIRSVLDALPAALPAAAASEVPGAAPTAVQAEVPPAAPDNAPR